VREHEIATTPAPQPATQIPSIGRECGVDKLHRFPGRQIEVSWSRTRCIHFAACVRGLPAVFQPGERPWIRLEGADAARVAEVVMRCPTGALHFEPLGGVPPERPDALNTIQVTPGGPLHVRGAIRIETEAGAVVLDDVRVALCRCGGSGNPPFCDGSHFRNGFADPGDVFEGGMKRGDAGPDPDAANVRTLHVVPAENGPLRLSGPMTLRSADGRMELAGTACSLCRCGGSRNKPFCDGTHRTLTPMVPGGA
jgi:CDGSH-type Zn-finger protein/uncharacterized Fe-S cluster protein YjdI